MRGNKRYDMRLLITTCLLLSSWLNLVAAQDYKVVCYFASEAVDRPGNGTIDISDLYPTSCTHMIYAFVGITESGGVKVLNPRNDLANNGGKNGFGRFNDLRKISPTTKTLVAIGGWEQSSYTFSRVTRSPQLRSTFVKNVVDFLLRYGFDGLDLHWKFPSERGGAPEDKANFVLLAKELRASFDPHKLLLSAAVGAPEITARISYDIGGISKHVDFINLMAYDFHGAWDLKTGENAPLYASFRVQTELDRTLNVNESVRYWLSQGASPEKLILGTALYGRSFTLASPDVNGIGAPITGPGSAGPYTRENGILGYNEICEDQMKRSWTVVRDHEQQVPYAFLDRQWVGYDDVKSITEKVGFARSMGLGGVMVWSMDTDDFRGICGEPYPLIRAVNEVLGRRIPAPPRATSTPATSSIPIVPTATPTVPPGTCRRPGWMRLPGDCAAFVKCVDENGTLVGYPYRCPSNFYFDTTMNACNYQDAVRC